mmetsp:Transcript_11097/g.35380  ORF Transcript_11097/g.35380 Transcript_11097/m.35380 type:complete len:260 (-) Transcript_11097:49-828(-)
MRGFIGNDKALKAALGFGVDLNGFSGGLGIAAKMVKDSSKQAVKKGVRGFTGKTECAWHPPPRHEMRAAAPRQFPPHEATRLRSEARRWARPSRWGSPASRGSKSTSSAMFPRQRRKRWAAQLRWAAARWARPSRWASAALQGSRSTSWATFRGPPRSSWSTRLRRAAARWARRHEWSPRGWAVGRRSAKSFCARSSLHHGNRPRARASACPRSVQRALGSRAAGTAMIHDRASGSSSCLAPTVTVLCVSWYCVLCGLL